MEATIEAITIEVVAVNKSESAAKAIQLEWEKEQRIDFPNTQHF